MVEQDLELYKEALGYTPSQYQADIFDFVVHKTGNAVIESYAGSGKTATIKAAMKLVPPKKRCLFLAFNKSIADELTSKLDGYKNCSVKTVHGLGLSFISKNIDKKTEIDNYKYITYLRRNLSELTTADLQTQVDVEEYIENVISLFEFTRQNLAQSVREIRKIAEKYSIDIKYDEDDVVHRLLLWGKENIDTVDYTDMVWLPNELGMTNKGNTYDWIFNDEAQDYSLAYVSLFKKCFKRGTRFISCGDMNQSINQFAGASEEAFNEMVNHKHTQIFKLPISYRCDVNIIKEANTLVPDILPREDAGLGLIKHNSSVTDINVGDMVLCRTNAPLIKMYSRLIKRGIPCYIKGQDENKERLMNTVTLYGCGEQLCKQFEGDGLFPRLYHDMITTRNRLVELGLDIHSANTSSNVTAKYDTIASLLTIASDCNTKTDLVERIEKIFSRDSDGVCLSTIHKAKGLEADAVHIACRSMIPQKSAKTESEIRQEMNLVYVAITRARHKLCYLSEKEFPPTKAFDTDEDISTEFKYIESKVCELYGGEPIDIISDIELAKIRRKNITQLDDIHKSDNRKVISKPTQTKKRLLDNL